MKKQALGLLAVLTKKQGSDKLQAMDQIIDDLIELLLRLKQWNWMKIVSETKQLSYVLVRQVFNQIPSISGIAALMIGGWVASTFTASPWKATLARWGLMKGGKHLVSNQMYQFLSVVLPILVAAVTAYLVQKLLKTVRERQMERNIVRVSQLGKDVQALVEEKLVILEKAREAGLLSSSEYLTKKANLYATYSHILPIQIKELLVSKITG